MSVCPNNPSSSWFLACLVIAVHADLQSGRDFLADAGVEIIRALGLDRIVLVRCRIEFDVPLNFARCLPDTFSTGGGVK